MIGKGFLLLLLLFGLYLPGAAMSVEELPILGAGPSTKVASLFFDLFSKTEAGQGYVFNVEKRSIKHAGGIRASGKYLFGRTGRPLSEKEKRANKFDLFLARIPLTMVVGEGAGVNRISLQQLQDILSRKITNWKQAGGADTPIELVGRENTEASFVAIKKNYPFFKHVKFDRVLKRDHYVVNFLALEKGHDAISFGAKPNFKDKNILQVDDFSSDLKLGLVYDGKNASHPLVRAVQQYAQSDEWKAALVENGLLPPN